MRDKWFLCCGLGVLAACDAYDASLLSSSRLGAPTAVKTDEIDEGSASAGAGLGASAADGGGRAAGEASAGGGDASADAGALRAGSGGKGGAGGGAAGAAAHGGSTEANAGHGGAGDGERSGGGGAGAGSAGSAGAANGGGCGEPDSALWTGNGHCYFSLSALGSWNVSRDGCSQRGAQLVTITSSDEQAFVANLVGTTPRWIGLSKFGAPAFTWIDGEALSYTNWETGAPGMSGEVAGALRDGTQRWFDDAVTASHAALCERP